MHSDRNFIDLILSRSSSVHDFKSVSLSCSTLLQTLMEYFETILLSTNILTNLHLKPTGLSKHQKHLNWTQASRIKTQCRSSPFNQVWNTRKKIVCMKKVYEIDHAETSWWIFTCIPTYGFRYMDQTSSNWPNTKKLNSFTVWVSPHLMWYLEVKTLGQFVSLHRI